MKARKRVVTSAAPATGSTKRRPTVRRIRSAIVPAPATPPSQAAARSAAAQARPAAAADARPDGVPAEGSGAAIGGSAATDAIDLGVEIGRGLRLATPLVLGSGAAGYGVEVAESIDLERVGALVTRGTTLRPRPGGYGRRMAEANGWLASAVGLQNPGIDAVLERYAPAWAEWGTPVIVNLAAESAAEFAELAARLDGVPGVAGIELNLACPNSSRGGLLFALDPTAAGSAVAAVRRACDLPMLVKLSAGAVDPGAVASAVEASGADAVVAINTLPGTLLDAGREGTALGGWIGGLSGPPLRPIALRVVHEVARAVEIPVIAAGGIATLDGVLDALAVGASAVAVTTAALADPGLPARLAHQLGDEVRRLGYTDLGPFEGSARPRRAPAPAARGSEYR